LYRSLSIKDNKAIIAFDHAENGLMSQGGELTHFEIAGEDKIFYPANATIEGESVVVSSEAVPVPFSVRYGWSATAEPNLFNAAGLPASPFRTDNWKRLSE
jgi:sialate O-acetylesterase